MFARPVIVSLALTLGASHVAAQAAAPAPAASPAGLTEWAIDPSHTRIGFSVPHMVVSEVDGQFKQWSGKALLDEKILRDRGVTDFEQYACKPGHELQLDLYVSE